MKQENEIGYADFLELCRVTDCDNWCDWLSVRGDGVYVKAPPSGATVAERAVLSEHSTGNLNTPTLPFPCTLTQLRLFLEQQGLYPHIDPFDMAEWQQRKTTGVGLPAPMQKPLGMTERTTLVTIIASLCDYSGIEIDARGTASQIAKLTEELGAPVSHDTVARVLRQVPDALETRMK